jgi:gliding motility-associated-like protein
VTGITTTGIWTTTGTGTFSPNATTMSATYTMSAADIGVGSVMLVLTSTNNIQCPSVSDTMYIIVEPLPVAAFSSVSGDSLDVAFTDQSTGAASWEWTFGDGGTSTAQNPLYVYPAAGNYTTMLVITSSGGCTDTAFTTVTAFETVALPIAIPTGFSPNGDGVNDVFHVLGGPFKEVDFKVYNDWGNLVYSTTDPEGGWDGTFKGQAQPGGVYVYTVTGTTTEGKVIKTAGNVTLIR